MGKENSIRKEDFLELDGKVSGRFRLFQRNVSDILRLFLKNCRNG